MGFSFRTVAFGNSPHVLRSGVFEDVHDAFEAGHEFFGREDRGVLQPAENGCLDGVGEEFHEIAGILHGLKLIPHDLRQDGTDGCGKIITEGILTFHLQRIRVECSFGVKIFADIRLHIFVRA